MGPLHHSKTRQSRQFKIRTDTVFGSSLYLELLNSVVHRPGYKYSDSLNDGPSNNMHLSYEWSDTSLVRLFFIIQVMAWIAGHSAIRHFKPFVLQTILLFKSHCTWRSVWLSLLHCSWHCSLIEGLDKPGQTASESQAKLPTS